MQKDFHYDVIYVLAIWAGFNDDDAFRLAYSSQYVDDANNNGRIKFKNKASYNRTSSAHENLDIVNNFDNVENRNTWLAFHFLPGNAGYQIGEENNSEFEDLLVCTPNSFVACDMVKKAIKTSGKDNAIHRLGIALHTYADTWAHHGFIGMKSEKNEVKNIKRKTINGDFELINEIEEIGSSVIDKCLPLGHGAVLCNPDLPFLEEWGFEYLDNRGEQTFNNTERFVEAADTIMKVMQLFIDYNKKQISLDENLMDILSEYEGLSGNKKELIKAIFTSVQDEKCEDRHMKWRELAQDGGIIDVLFIPEYISKGKGSWKEQALGICDIIENPNERYDYNETFLNSDWKKFHDALQKQRQYILIELFTLYNICIS